MLSEDRITKADEHFFKPMLTMPVPFSFEERDKNTSKKRNEWLNEVLKEEKKMREFHASPVPRSIYKSSQKHQKDVTGNIFQTPPHTESGTVVVEFHLRTEQRAKERQEYEKAKRERQEAVSAILKRCEERLLRVDLEETVKMRKGAEHKAQPIRQYKDVRAIPPKPLTVPVSPKLSERRNRNCCKENMPN